MTHQSRRFEGIYPVLCTPFDEKERIDEECLQALIEFQIRAGVQGVVVLGLAGEVFKLSDRERNHLVHLVVKYVDGRLPVVAGSGHSSTMAAVEMSVEAARAGVQGVMVMPPVAPGASTEDLVDYFGRIARAIDVPIMVQDAPGATQTHMSVDLLTRLSQEHPLISHVKIESAPTTPKIKALAERGTGLVIVGGMGGTYFPDELVAGSRGTLIGCAFPEHFVKVWQAFCRGEIAEARAMHERMLPLLTFQSQGDLFLHVQKEILRRAGIFKTAKLRKPASEMAPIFRSLLAELLERIPLLALQESSKT